MIRIAISQAVFDTIAATMSLGSVNSEYEADANGERLIWLPRAVVDRLRAVEARIKAEKLKQNEFLTSRLEMDDRARRAFQLRRCSDRRYGEPLSRLDDIRIRPDHLPVCVVEFSSRTARFRFHKRSAQFSTDCRRL